MTPKTLVLALLVLAGTVHAQVCPAGATKRRIVICQASSSLDECRAEALKVGCAVIRNLPLIHAVVIRVPARKQFSVFSAQSVAKLESIHDDEPVHWISNLPDFNPGALPDFADITKSVKALPRTKAPTAGGPEIPWGVERVGAPLAWKQTQGEGAAVAVIDTGIDLRHPCLQGQVIGGVNVLDPQHPDNYQDDEGHGTHVSGTIAGNAAGKCIAGVAPKAKLYAVKVLDKDGNGNYSDVITGIEWAMNHGVKIANMSLGADEGSEPLHRAIQAALQKGMLIVAAAGNSGGAVGYPGAYPETIAVAASNKENQVAPFSSHGQQVSFIAPGVDIVSAKLGTNTTTLMSGTSMASPHIAGLAALAFSEGARTPSAIRSALTKATTRLPGLTPDYQGNGMVLAGNLVQQFPDANRGALAMLQ